MIEMADLETRMMLNMAGHPIDIGEPEGHIENLYADIFIESKGPINTSNLDL